MKQVRFERVHHEAKLPTRGTPQSSGLDLYAAEPVSLAPGERKLIDTGLTIALPEGYEGQVRPRSGLAVKYGITVLNAPGTVDADYRGPLKVLLINHGNAVARFAARERIAQLVVCPVEYFVPVEGSVDEDTERGARGFGSTGTR
jgi:dUTP pyrophosphatase